MIIDNIDTTGIHKNNRALQAALGFLKGLAPDTPEGEYEIEGRAIFARVMRYETRERSEGRMESHRKYADIQALLSGREVVEWSHTGSLGEAPHDEEADVGFHPTPPECQGRFVLMPGLFALFMPHDAHMPMLRAGDRGGGGDNTVTKVVVKVDASLLDWTA